MKDAINPVEAVRVRKRKKKNCYRILKCRMDVSNEIQKIIASKEK
jgi:hypothetical protein